VTRGGRRNRAWALAFISLVPMFAATACTGPVAGAPRCGSIERVAIIAQSVPSTSHVSCIIDLPAGWSTGQLRVQNGLTRFVLVSDRAPGHPVTVDVGKECAIANATPIAPRTPGGRTYLWLRQIDPRYAGTMYDVFPGGCVSYRFDFARGPHIALMAQIQSIVGLVARTDLRRELRDRLGLELDP
jgi:hypothetical protein